MTLEAARPVLREMRDALPAELASKPLSAAAWDRWVRAQDREIRSRVAQGEELTLVNLLRQGIAYTHEPRITYTLLHQYGQDPSVNGIAERRAADLLRALSAARGNEGMREMRTFLKSQGLDLNTAESKNKVKAYLLASLARQRDEVSREREQASVDHSQLFRDRGLSTDSDIYTGYTIELELRKLAQRGLLQPGSVRRVAIIGPGLDFVNKKFGYDFYPPQTIQPFTVIDSLLRLGLADPNRTEVYTFDISPAVNRHIERAKANVGSGSAYTLQLLWNRNMTVSGSFLAGFKAYWRRMGSEIAKPAPPLAVPQSVQAEVASRAVSIRPEVVAKIVPVDLNIIVQTEQLQPGQRFDLVIGTNVFLYYDGLQQSLAQTNLAQMIKPGGLLLSNTALRPSASSHLTGSVRTDVLLRPDLTDSVYSYLLRN
jgi:hypothetical protein